MKRWLLVLTVFALVLGAAGLATAASRLKASIPTATPARAAVAVNDDPDLPSSLAGGLDKGTYMQLREAWDQLRYGDAPFDQVYQGRLNGIAQLQHQSSGMAPFTLSSAWTEIGPYPIPNGQTTNISVPVSGRVTAIAIHPTNPNIVYVGAAQGGVWRSTDGGATWVAIFDNAQSLAIGALALAPSNPSILYVGTGEANLSADSFFGVGLYRIDNADTAPVLNGPFNPVPTTDVIGAQTFTGRAISQILVNPSDPATIFVSTCSGIGGLGGEAFGSSPPVTSLRGVYRSTNGTSASPAFTKLTVSSASSIAPDVTGNQIANDMIYDPTDPSGNTLLVWLYPAAATTGGVFRTTNALAPTPTFVQTFSPGVVSIRGSFTQARIAGVTTMYMTTGEAASGTGCTSGSGCIRKSTDGGATWSGKLAGAGGFCGGQCFYDVPIAVNPTDATQVLVGGAGNAACSRVFARSTDGGATFTGAGVGDTGLHADAHCIAYAPSNPNIVFEGNDGGIFKSLDAGATWSSANTAGFSATQFQSIDVHPIDSNFSIGGTQDNGTNMYQPAATWNHIDFGDGGFAVIDQNAPDNSNVTMYHTYYNQRASLVGYAVISGTANAFDGNWGFSGQNANNISTNEFVNFYAPLVRGPGNPNPIYYATDRLHRSTDGGLTNPVVSQAPIVASTPISAVGIASQNDNIRLVGLNNSTIWGTVTGSSVLTNMTGGGMPVKYISRITIDPTNANVAYVCFGGFNIPLGQHVWKTTNLLSGTPTWAASGSGLPDVPANAFAIDPLQPSRLWAGTDVGVYMSVDGGATWAPFSTGLPIVAVFDMKLTPVSRILRIATHGRGMWERYVDQPTATQLALVGTEMVDGHPKMTWYSADGANERMHLYRRALPNDWLQLGDLTADASGLLSYTDLATQPGHSYEYRIGVMSGTTERLLGDVWVDIPLNATFALKRLSSDQSGPLQFAVSLPVSSPARLELIDVTGRRISSTDLTALGAGDHQVKIDASNARPGIYWARLVQADKQLSTRVVLTH